MKNNISTKKTPVVLQAKVRQHMKKHANHRLRAEGRVPAIVYGVHSPLPISIDLQEFNHAFRHISENTLIDIKVDDKVRHVLIKDYSIETLSDKVIHLDFLEVEKGKLLKTHIPLIAVGSAIGSRSGGVFEQAAHEIEIECLPKDIPDTIEVNIDHLEIGQSIRISDLSLPKGVRSSAGSDVILCHVTAVRASQIEDTVEPEEDQQDINDTTAE